MENQTKLYSQNGISLATLLGGPIAAGVLIYKNFKVIGKKRHAINSLIISIVVTLFIVGLVIALPENTIDRVPTLVLPSFYALIIYFIVDIFMGENLKSHYQNGGKFFSLWRAAGIGTLSLAAFSILLFGIVYLVTPEPGFDYQKYDEELAIFTRNEKKAMQVYSLAEGTSNQRLLRELKIGLDLWKKNKTIIEQLSATSNLPNDLVRQNQLLLEYALLRIVHYEYIIKSVEENNDAYNSKIMEIGLKIDKIIITLENYNQGRVAK